MAGDTRVRMVEAAVGALRRRGVAAMSFTEVLQASGAARGAIYHHFPGGKAQLVAEAVKVNGSDVRAHFEQLPAVDPQGAVRAFFDAVRPVIEQSTTGSGCAVAAVALGADDDQPQLREVAASAFASWTEALAGRLARAGVPEREAAGLATTLIMMLEGAHVLCRACGGMDPFDRAVGTATALVAASYPASGGASAVSESCAT